MAPFGVQDMKRVVVHIGHRLFVLQVMVFADIPHRNTGPADQDEKYPLGDLGLGQVLGRKLVLARPDSAIDEGNVVGFGIAPNATTETTRHSHQVCVIQRIVRPR